ncbi:MAG: cupredoxin domain-containing protein [Solirubrobacteraceae bacterium]
MSRPRRLLVIGSSAAILVLAAVGIAIALTHTDQRPAPGTVGTYPGGGVVGQGGSGMMGQGGNGMMSGGFGPGGTPGSQGTTQSGQVAPRGAQTLTLDVRSDSEHGRRGPDGTWHDAFLPADFAVHPGYAVTVTVSNYDDMPHSFTSRSLGVNETIPAGSASAPSKMTFTFTAPSKPGSYQWWCALPCDPWAMTHDGYMRGDVTVRA